MGKPVICFGYAWYRGLPGCFRWEDLEGAVEETIQKFCFDRAALQRGFQERCRLLWPGVWHKAYATAIPDYDTDAYLVKAVKSSLSYLRQIGFDAEGNPICEKHAVHV